MSDYTTADGEDVPQEVAETFDPPEEWGQFADPQNVQKLQSVFGVVYRGRVEEYEHYVSEHGNFMPTEEFRDVPSMGDLTIPMREKMFTYGDYDIVHRDHFVEHITRVKVVTESGLLAFNSRSGIVWEDTQSTDRDVRQDEEAMTMAMALVEADNSIGLPERIERVKSGWHGTFRPSEQSEQINALAKGDIPPHCDESIYPYAVVFEDGNNVCSQPISLYGNEQFDRMLEQENFSNSRTEPGHAGVS